MGGGKDLELHSFLRSLCLNAAFFHLHHYALRLLLRMRMQCVVRLCL